MIEGELEPLRPDPDRGGPLLRFPLAADAPGGQRVAHAKPKPLVQPRQSISTSSSSSSASSFSSSSSSSSSSVSSSSSSSMLLASFGSFRLF